MAMVDDLQDNLRERITKLLQGFHEMCLIGGVSGQDCAIAMGETLITITAQYLAALPEDTTPEDCGDMIAEVVRAMRRRRAEGR